jgi:hypothetical protein
MTAVTLCRVVRSASFETNGPAPSAVEVDAEVAEFEPVAPAVAVGVLVVVTAPPLGVEAAAPPVLPAAEPLLDDALGELVAV